MLIDDILLLPAQERERLHPVFPDLGHAQVYDITDVARFGLALDGVHVHGASHGGGGILWLVYRA